MRRLIGHGRLSAALILCLTAAGAAHAAGVADLVPPDAAARLDAISRQAGIDTAWREARERAVARVIDPSDYECGPTGFNTWIDAKFGAVENFGAFIDILNVGALDWPTYYSLIIDNDASDDYMGVNGEQTHEMVKRHRDAQRFWDVPTDDILLQGMHGADIADDAKMIPVVQLILGVDATAAAGIVDYVQSVIEADPGLGYDNPLFTLNAFAFTSEGAPVGSPFYGVPDKIVMGDGISAALADLGLGTNAPDYVHAHEFGHHVQFELGVFDTFGGAPEDTRRTELMADAFGAYLCAHSRGASFQAKRIADVYGAGYLIGDCAFDNPGHHGTPNQREASTMWAAGVADNAENQGHIYSAQTMLELFDAQLPTLVAPDAP